MRQQTLRVLSRGLGHAQPVLELPFVFRESSLQVLQTLVVCHLGEVLHSTNLQVSTEGS